MPGFRERTVYWVFKPVRALFAVLPRKICLSLGRSLGLIFYHLDKKHRRIALSNLSIAFGAELSVSEQKKIAKNSFRHFGEFLAEGIKFPCLDEEKKNGLIDVEGEDYLDKALQEKRGALLFSAHYGNWEVAQHFLSKKGEFSVVARPLDNRLLEKELFKLRTGLGAKVIYKLQATKKVLQALRAKEMVVFLIDQNVLRQQAVFVDFFGKKAATTPALAAFYLRTKSPLIPAFCCPTSAKTYRIQILSPLEILPEKDQDQVLKITQTCTNIIEAQIRRKPDYWLWFHNRWRTRPKEESKR